MRDEDFGKDIQATSALHQKRLRNVNSFLGLACAKKAGRAWTGQHRPSTRTNSDSHIDPISGKKACRRIDGVDD